MLALIDADSLLYKAASVSSNLDEAILKFRNHITNIAARCIEVNVTAYNLYVGKGKSHRFSFYPEYKANRVNNVLPYFFNDLKEYVITSYNTIVFHGIEADDVVAVHHTPGETLLCHIDKDLNQLAGLHFNYNTFEFYEVSPEEAERFLYIQVLAGDSIDNIKGCPKIGVKKADKILKKNYDLEAYQAYYNYYQNQEQAWNNYLLNYRLVKLGTNLPISNLVLKNAIGHSNEMKPLLGNGNSFSLDMLFPEIDLPC